MLKHVEDVRSIWARALALLAVLCGLQVALLIRFGDALVVAHWWMDISRSPLAFWKVMGFLFAVLLVLAFEGRRLSPSGVRAVIFTFFATGLVAALMGLQVMGKSYLQIWLNGELSLFDISNYLFLDFLDRKPWLILYVFVFLFVYAWTRWKRRETWSLYALAIMAPIYAGLNSQALISQRPVLVLLQILGACGLLVYFLRREPVQPGSAGYLLALVLLAGFVLTGVRERFSGLSGHFVVAATATLLLYGASWFLLLKWGYTPRARAFLPFLWMTFFFVVSQYYPVYRRINRLAVYVLSMGHYFWGHVLCSAVFLGVGLLLRRWSFRLVIVLDVCAVLLMIVSIVDYHVTSLMGTRLDWQILTMSDSATLLLKTVWPYLTWGVFATLGVCTLAYAAGVSLISRPRAFGRLSRAVSSAGFLYVAAFFVATSWSHHLLICEDKYGGNPVLRILHTTPVIRRATYDKLSREDFESANRTLGIPTFMTNDERMSTARPETTERLNLVFIMLESMANEHLSLFGSPDETQPLLSRYANRMELFPNFFVIYPMSNHSRFSSFSGLYASRKYATYVNPRIRSRSLFEILHEHGYHNAFFYSSYRTYTRLIDYLGHRKINEIYDATNMPGAGKDMRVAWGIREEGTLRAMQDFIRERARQADPFFLTYIPVAPHLPYDTNEKRFRVFQEGFGMLDGNFVGLFKNTLLYMDWILSSLVECLEEEGLLDSTLVIITNDHGEMLGEIRGLLGHGFSLAPRLSNIPLIIMDPRQLGRKVNTTVGSHVDLLPTMLDMLNIPLPEDDLYQGVSLYSKTAGAHPIYILSATDRAIVENSSYVLETTREGAENRVCKLYHIRNDDSTTAFEFAGELPADVAGDYKRRLDLYQQMQNSFIRFYDAYRRERLAFLRKEHPVPSGAPAEVDPSN